MEKLLLYLNASETITYTISGVLVGTKIDDYYDHEYKGYTITVDDHHDGSGNVYLENSKGKWILVFRTESDYPELIIGDDETIGVSSGYIKDGRLIASSLDPFDTDFQKIGNPLIDVRDLSLTEDGMEEIEDIIRTLKSKSVYATYDPEQKAIVVLPIVINGGKSIDFSEMPHIIGRMYYPTSRPDTDPTPSNFKQLHQSNMDTFVEDGTPVGSLKAVKIMSETPTYLNKDLLDSLPKIDSGSADTTMQVLNNSSMTPIAFKRIKEAYNNGTVDELLSDMEFADAWRRKNYDVIRDKLGLFKNDKISDSLLTLYGIRSKDLDNILKVYDDPITVDGKVYDVFADPNVKDISHAKLYSDEYIKYNDVNDAVYRMFTSRGERMYADGADNYQSNTIIRENLRFAPTDASNIDRDDYKNNLLQTIGGSLVEDGYIDTKNIKYTKDELVDLAQKFIDYGYDPDTLTPRLKSQMRAYRNVEEFGVVDTGLTTTLDSTFSGLAVNSAITGKTNNIGMINIHGSDVPDEEIEGMRDLYSDVGDELIDKLIDLGVNRKKARKLVKPGVMTAMYNSSERRRNDKLTSELRKELKEYTDDIEGTLSELKPYIKKTTSSATDVLSGVIKEQDVMDLVDKGIIQPYKSDNGMPVPFTPKDNDELVRLTAGIRINKPDGTHTTLMNDASTVEFKDGVLRASKNDHVKPFVETTKVKDGVYTSTENTKKFLDNVSTAIARSYDSYVASYVVEKLHDEDIPVVTTHDAFTVPVYASEKTRELYNEAINNIYEFGGSDKRVNARNNLSTE